MTPKNSDENLVGVVLQDSFRLTGLIGKGGMGTVYEGTQLRLNKRVAVKLLARDLSANEEALVRFRREAEVTSQLGHPHIVQVFDFGTAPSGEPYLVMEHLEGEDLDQRIRRVGRLRLTAVVNVVKQIASALAATHARGIVHRDLKPANVFLLEAEGETDFVKILDFGISKVRAASVRITGQSVVMGTPNYMSPEQALGQLEIDHKTDQWSLACIAYEMLAGRGPFVGDTVQSLLYQVVHEDPPSLRTLVSNLPEEVERVIHRALAKRPGDRFPTVNAFSRALAAASPGPREDIAPSSAAEPPIGSTVMANLAHPPAGPSPTTLSRTASEILSFSQLRRHMTPKGLAAVAVTGAAVVLVGVLSLRAPSRHRPDVQPLPALTRSPPAEHVPPSSAVIVTPLPSALPSAVPAPPPSNAAVDRRFGTSGGASPTSTVKLDVHPKRRRRNIGPDSADATTITPASESAKPNSSPPPKAQPSSPTPRKPHLIEDL